MEKPSRALEKSQAQGHGRREEQQGLCPQPTVTRMDPSEFREVVQRITGPRSGSHPCEIQIQDHQMDEVVQGQSLLPPELLSSPSATMFPRSLEYAVKPSTPVDTTANDRFGDGYNKRTLQQFRSQVEQTRQSKRTLQKLHTEAPVCAMADAMFRLPAKLVGLLARHGHMLSRGTEDEISLIKQDLERMISFLQEQDDSGAEDTSMMVKCLTKEVRELSYDMEDSVDQYMHAANSRRGMLSPRHKKYKFTRRKSRTTTWLSEKLKWRLWMANKIREFSMRSQEALQRYNMFSLGGTGSSTSPRRGVSFGSWFPTLHGELVGIDDHLNTLEAWLGKDEDRKLKVVSVVGSGGIGKTTLAKELYRRIRGQFQCQAFVSTSRKPDIRRLLISMLSQVRPHQTPHTCTLHSLIADIRTHLRDKRYLIVIDDVWATQTWDIINRALPSDNLCSGILITTEVDDLALKCCGYDSNYVLTMKPLGHNDSSKLFFNTTFGPQYECPPELSEAANIIVRKCAGLPLAMVTVASLLVNQMGKPERWDYVNECLGYGLRTNPSTEGMKQVLNLSFNNLPQHLKACVMYLSIYEEDCIILKDDLVKQWIAEGFIHATEEEDIEELSRICFDELISRRMIQPVHTNDNNDVLSCTVHWMILDFIKHKSLEENFVTAIDNCQTTTPLADKVRRLSLHFGNAEATPPINMRLSQVRTLAFFGVIKCLPSILEFGLLQVLILHLWGDDESICVDLTGISELFRLKYLHATCNATLELPQTQMRGLQYLETLKIDARVSAVPADIVHLPGLLHLSLHVETNLPNSIGRMTSLCTLGYFDLSVNSIDNVQSLSELSNLRDLRLTCSTVHSSYLKSKMGIMGSILAKLSNLRSVTLEPSGILDSGPSSMSISCDDLSRVSSPPALLQRFEWLPCICTFSSIPMWIGHLNKLCILKIGVRELASNDVDVLRGLPALTVLSLYVRGKPAERIVFTKTGFSVLKCLKFRCSVPWLEFEVNAMPNLLKLKLGFNAHGVDQRLIIPVGIMHLTGLKEISAKIGGVGAIDPDRRVAESALVDAIKMHPARPTFNIQYLDRIFSVKDDNNSGVQEEEHMTLQKQYDIMEEDSIEQHIVLQKDTREDAGSSKLQNLEKHIWGLQKKLMDKLDNLEAKLMDKLDNLEAKTESMIHEVKLACLHSNRHADKHPRLDPYLENATASEPNANIHLRFLDGLTTPIYRDKIITSDSNAAIRIGVFDGDKMISEGPLSKAKVEILVLRGDFCSDGQESWTEEEFNSYIAQGRHGKGSVLGGDCTTWLNNGVASLGRIRFREGSSRTRSRKFIVGARVCMNEKIRGVRVQEAVMGPVTVLDRRNKANEKRHPPRLDDEVYRLEEISRDGIYHRRLNNAQIFNVEDFLKALNKDADKLRAMVLQINRSNAWERMVKHARECCLADRPELKAYRSVEGNVVIFLNCVHDLVGAIFSGVYISRDNFDPAKKAQAYELKECVRNQLDSLPFDYVMNDNLPEQVPSSTHSSLDAVILGQDAS